MSTTLRSCDLAEIRTLPGFDLAELTTLLSFKDMSMFDFNIRINYSFDLAVSTTLLRTQWCLLQYEMVNISADSLLFAKNILGCKSVA
jgi:hypothetical protein